MIDPQTMQTRPCAIMILLAVLAMTTATVRAQDDTSAVVEPPGMTPVSIGLSGGYGAHLYFGSIDLCETPEINQGLECSVLESGNGSATSLGITGMYRFSEKHALGVRIFGERNTGSMSVPAADAASVRNSTGGLIAIESIHRLQLDMTLATLELTWMMRPFDLPLELSAGPRMSLVFDGAYEAREEIPEEAGVSFVENGLPVRSYAQGDFDGSMLVGLVAGAAWPLPLSRTITAVPGIDLWGYANSVVPFGSARMAGARATASLIYTIPEPGPEPPPPPPPAPPPPPVVASLSAEIRGSGLTPENQPTEAITVTVDETVQQSMVPLLPYVFFAQGSSTIGDAYVVNRSAPRSPLDLYYALLPTVGARLVANPSERITLAAGYTDDETEAVARSRAESVREYLTSTWSIDPERVDIRVVRPARRPSGESAEEVGAESRRVEIRSGGAILEPLALTGVDTRIASPGVHFDVDIDAEAGLSGWMLEFGFNGQPIRRLRGGVSYTSNIDERFSSTELSRIVAADAASIDYSLRVQDSAGSEFITAAQPIPVRINRTSDTILMRGAGLPAATILFEYDSHTLTPDARDLLASLRRRLPEGAALQITGYADETGTSEHNMALSIARARAVAAALNGFETSVEGMGENGERFPNTSPEGRYYSRSATVHIADEIPESEDEVVPVVPE